jgi:hypothetical protein
MTMPSKGDSGYISKRGLRPMALALPSQHHKLVQDLIDHEQPHYRTRRNLCISSSPADPPHIHCQSFPSIGPFQTTTVLVTQSPFRHRVQTIAKLLDHVEDAKSASNLTQKVHNESFGQ